jgi:hypothetical protein
MEGRSFASEIGGSVAGGAASAVVGNVLDGIESLFRREDILARSDAWTINELD